MTKTYCLADVSFMCLETARLHFLNITSSEEFYALGRESGYNDMKGDIEKVACNLGHLQREYAIEELSGFVNLRQANKKPHFGINFPLEYQYADGSLRKYCCTNVTPVTLECRFSSNIVVYSEKEYVQVNICAKIDNYSNLDNTVEVLLNSSWPEFFEQENIVNIHFNVLFPYDLVSDYIVREYLPINPEEIKIPIPDDIRIILEMLVDMPNSIIEDNSTIEDD